MKTRLFVLLLVGLLVSCNFDKSKERQFEINQTLKSGKSLFVQDSSQYSPDFISELRTLDGTYNSIRLIGRYLIIKESDTCIIPTELPVGETLNYQATNGDTVYLLGLKRINYTNINYDFMVNDKLIKSGQVLLPADLCLGYESTDDNGELVPLTQYFDKKDIWTCIKIEIGNANRVDFYMQSDNDSTKNYKNVPILRKK